MAGPTTTTDLKEQLEDSKVTPQEIAALQDKLQNRISLLQSTMDSLVSTISDLKKQLAGKQEDDSIAGSLDSKMEKKKATPTKNENKISLKDSELDSLPQGYYFLPSDTVLINALKAKILNQQYLFSDKYKTLDFYNYQPQELAELYEPGRERVWYFFVKKDKSKICDSVKAGVHRIAKDGNWRGLDHIDIRIKINGNNAHKKHFIFLEGGEEEYDVWGVMTDWVMQEYRIDDDPKLDGWALCKMYMMDDSRKRKRDIDFEPYMYEREDCDFELLELKLYHIFGDHEAIDSDSEYEYEEDSLSIHLRH